MVEGGVIENLKWVTCTLLGRYLAVPSEATQNESKTKISSREPASDLLDAVGTQSNAMVALGS
jgi:hypothetical protein